MSSGESCERVWESESESPLLFIPASGGILLKIRLPWSVLFLKNVWTSDKSWEPAKLDTLDMLNFFFSHTLSLSHTLNMLNNFCFHVYAQKSISHFHTLRLSHSRTLTLSFSHSITLDMLNKFCFHLYAQNSPSHFLTLTLSRYLTLTLFQSLIQSLSTCWTSFVFISRLKSHCF